MSVPTTLLDPEVCAAFSDDARRAIYECIALRRDIRHFRPGVAIDPAVLTRILGAAHQAPSVGFSQPWGFVVIREASVRERVRSSFLRCREAEASRFPAQRREQYLAHKLEGICEASLNLCVAVDLRDRGEAILGTTVQPEAVRASACCAVQNLWLAARAEGIGVGWVSIVEPAVLREELGLPAGVEPIAYLCLGHPVAFRRRPMLEETGWRPAVSLDHAVHWDGRWQEPEAAATHTPAAAARASQRAVLPASVEARAAARTHSATLTKPVASLGRLEELAAFYAGARGVFPPPALTRATLALFLGDHGVAVEAVSAFGSQVTARMAGNVMSGGAAVSAIAADCRVDIVLTDVGTAGDLSSLPTGPLVELHRRRVRAGTRNLAREPAMTLAEAEAALNVGAETARAAIAEGSDALALGEIGIANTTAAAALVSVFTGIAPAHVTGRGTGIADAVLARKIAVIESALALHRPDPTEPLAVLAALGGLEIAALVGCMTEAARHRLPIVLDGLVTNAAALVAVALEPNVSGYLLAAHESTEPGARAALGHLNLQPLLQLGMRLGEGTGACLGVALLRTAVLTQLSMATFASAGIVGRAGIAGPTRG
ncbi:MAG TPA: nicotinate-nucleotide--dimethylbenzimidazole phosphoribosyltransferase [Polyangiaceae bacterium]|jgi:nicotinate-nucleotide--dimethylbenzimidazole phosphoribosyltransferase|nr:nicotinate-nucleotide--dimethylbenzimidazole phosphoribosyltransferase [Polyangiaceae bacterium]